MINASFTVWVAVILTAMIGIVGGVTHCNNKPEKPQINNNNTPRLYVPTPLPTPYLPGTAPTPTPFVGTERNISHTPISLTAYTPAPPTHTPSPTPTPYPTSTLRLLLPLHPLLPLQLHRLKQPTNEYIE